MKTKPAYTTLTLVIDQMVADTLDRNTIESLRNMLDLPAFQPIHDVIEKKIIEVGNYLKSKEEEEKEKEILKDNPLHRQAPMGAGELTDKINSLPDLPDGIEIDYEYEANLYTNFQYIKDKFDSSLEFDVTLPPEKDPV